MSGFVQCMCCSAILLVLVVVVYVALSVSSLAVNTYGLDYSPITKQINENVYTSGYHFIGFMHKFIEYPSQMQTLEFSDGANAARGVVEARSKDGLMVNFRATF